MTARVRFLSLAALSLAAAGCARCAGPAQRLNAEELVAREATLAISIPAPGELADHAQALIGNVRGGPGGAEVVQFSANLARQLGFDPLKRDGLQAAGLDPTRSLAVAANPARPEGNGAHAALPYADLKKLEATIERLARDRLGAGVRETRTVDGKQVQVLCAQAGGTPAFAWVTKSGYLLLGAGAGAAASALAMLDRKPEGSLVKVPAFAASKEKTGPRDVYVYLPRTESAAMKGMPEVVTVGLALAAKEASARGYTGLAAERAAQANAALPGGGDELLRKLPAGSPVYVRGGLDLSAIAKEMDKSPSAKRGLDRLRAALAEAGLDLEKDVLANVEPSFAVTAGIAKSADLSGAFELDPRRSNPFRTYTVLALGRVRDPAKAAAALAKLPAAGPKLGLEIETKELAGTTVYLARYQLGEGLAWALRGNELLLAGGLLENLEGLLKGDVGAQGPVKPESFEARSRDVLFSKPGIALAVDFARIGEAVSKLPDGAFGSGPGAYMARSVVSGVVQPLSRLKMVAAVQPTAGGVVIDLSAALQ